MARIKAPAHYEMGHIGYRTSLIAVKRETGWDNPICVEYDDYMDIYTYEVNGEYIYVDSDGGISC